MLHYDKIWYNITVKINLGGNDMKKVSKIITGVVLVGFICGIGTGVNDIIKNPEKYEKQENVKEETYSELELQTAMSEAMMNELCRVADIELSDINLWDKKTYLDGSTNLWIETGTYEKDDLEHDYRVRGYLDLEKMETHITFISVDGNTIGYEEEKEIAWMDAQDNE